VLGMSNIQGGAVVGEPSGYVSNVKSHLLLAPDDLLFNRTNSRELVGKVGIVRTPLPTTTFASYLVRLRVNHRALPAYVNYVLNSTEVLALARSMALPSIGQANLNPNRYSTLEIPVPARREQRAIVTQLDAASRRTAQISRRLGDQMALLKERRQALITAAVTGQVDVPVAA
jgi:type I restriction enzyme, S subunit